MANGKVLVIDDDKIILSMVGRILTGIECEMVNPQEQDILSHQIFKHDCSIHDAPFKGITHVFSDFDYKLVQVNGLMVLKLIRKIPCLKDVHMVLATGGFPLSVVEADVHRDLRDYNITLLEKPFNMARLLEAMKII